MKIQNKHSQSLRISGTALQLCGGTMRKLSIVFLMSIMGWTSFGNLGTPSPAIGQSKTDKAIKVRLTTYHRAEDYWTRKLKSSSGYTLKEGVSVAADPKIFDYGTKIYIEGVGERQIHDTGTAVVSREASNGKLPIIDVFFISKESADHFANTHKYARVWVVSN